MYTVHYICICMYIYPSLGLSFYQKCKSCLFNKLYKIHFGFCLFVFVLFRAEYLLLSFSISYPGVHVLSHVGTVVG